ncbi:molybdopterin biosynthesis enzyme [Falsochrobactrum shanghaiense]|uniref:Molybdopterin biosynthesis enzyme n=1 Tax=Falsochrobactrum shanghaiense TaxID=2201899 RepID=A0A316JFP8_9HYPH|nr:molybdopterin-binding protein [Falsochrobactrum shanghaiense]PWL19405.1 molybdopterin biosynthesis enzyme [Falsochrobactrum shanghaiense]
MIFREWPLEEAEGTIIANSLVAEPYHLRKGTVLESGHLEAMRRAGMAHVLAAKLETDDMGENDAAAAIGRLLVSGNIESGVATTGRINLFAQKSGVFCADIAGVDAINMLDERISVASLHNHNRVEGGQMVATVKIIPFAVPKSLIDEIYNRCGERAMFDVKAFQATRIGLIQSRLPAIRETVLAKTQTLIARRAERNGGRVCAERRVAHESTALATAIAELAKISDLLVIFSASAVADEADIVPRAIIQAGGEILRIGVPVDPGNLLSVGKCAGKYVVVAPGSARSARESSLDRIIDRLMAGIELQSADLARMGVGGLLL